MQQRDVYETGFDESYVTPRTASCPECSGQLRTDNGERGCIECGLIVSEDWLDRGPRPAAFDSATRNRERTGMPLTSALHDRGLTTEIGKLRDGNGNVLSAAKRRELDRLRTQNSRARWGSKAERNLGVGLGEISRISSVLECSRAVKDRACELFREAQRENLLQGRSIEDIAAASVYAACRCLSHTRRLSEVTAASRGSDEGVVNGYRTLNRELGLQPAIVRPEDFLPGFASDLDVPVDVRIRGRELVELAEAEGICNGRRPSGVAAAALYLAAREHGWPLNQADVAEVADTSTVTVRHRYREMVDAVE